jgi:hypothetical protein
MAAEEEEARTEDTEALGSMSKLTAPYFGVGNLWAIIQLEYVLR